MSLLKRKRSEPSGTRKQLTSDEQTVYNVIKSNTNIGISKMDLKRELNMRDKAFNSCIKTLKEKAKIKEVKSVKSKWGHLMAVEFEPSNVVTGGLWYSDGKLDTDFVENLTKISLAFIRSEKVATAQQAREMVMASKVFNGEMSVNQIKEILETLVLDKEVMKVKSTGSGEYASVPAGTVFRAM